MATTFYLIRHGETHWNRQGRVQGWSDIPLTATGERQAKALAEYLQTIRPDRIISSDLVRAQRTAEAVAAFQNKPVDLEPALRERCLGSLEGRIWRDLQSRLKKTSEGRYALAGFPGVEPYDMFRERLLDVMERLAMEHEGDTLFLVSHGGFIANFLFNAHLIRAGDDFRLANTSVTTVHRREEQGWQVERLGDVGHLADTG